MWTCRGGQGSYAFGGNFRVGEIVNICFRSDLAGQYRLAVRRDDGTVSYSTQGFLYQGSGNAPVSADMPPGSREITFEVWAGGMYGKDVCRVHLY